MINDLLIKAYNDLLIKGKIIFCIKLYKYILLLHNYFYHFY